MKSKVWQLYLNPCVRNSFLNEYFIYKPDTVAMKIPKELNPKKTVKNPKENEEKCDIVNLLAGSLENLVESSFWHWKLETRADVADHYEGPRGSGKKGYDYFNNRRLSGIGINASNASNPGQKKNMLPCKVECSVMII